MEVIERSADFCVSKGQVKDTGAMYSHTVLAYGGVGDYSLSFYEVELLPNGYRKITSQFQDVPLQRVCLL